MPTNQPPRKITPVTVNPDDIPKDSIFLTESEALKLQWDIIHSWKPRSDVWPFTFGIGLLGAAAGISGFLTTAHYRKRLNLLHHGRAATYISSVIFPTFLGTFLHRQMVSRDIVLYKKVCPVCMESRAMVLQTISGVVYPLAWAPAATFHLASRLLTYPIPNGRKDLWFTYLKLTKPLFPTVVLLLAVNLVAAMYISFEEIKAIHRVSMKIDKMYESGN